MINKFIFEDSQMKLTSFSKFLNEGWKENEKAGNEADQSHGKQGTRPHDSLQSSVRGSHSNVTLARHKIQNRALRR